MITGISMNKVNTYKPSFGLAKLNTLGRQTEDTFGYTSNDFINGDMYAKPKAFEKPAIASHLSNGESLVDICSESGCTNNPKANADFIRFQILSKKAQSVLKKVPLEEKESAYFTLYKGNYDNPILTTGETLELLTKAKNKMTDEEYVQQVGVMKAGTQG